MAVNSYYLNCQQQISICEGVIEKFRSEKNLEDEKSRDEENWKDNMFSAIVDCVGLLKESCIVIDELKNQSIDSLKKLTTAQEKLLSESNKIISPPVLVKPKETFSNVVSQTPPVPVTVKDVKDLVQDIVKDRSNNLMVFGLAEMENEC